MSEIKPRKLLAIRLREGWLVVQSLTGVYGTPVVEVGQKDNANILQF